MSVKDMILDMKAQSEAEVEKYDAILARLDEELAAVKPVEDTTPYDQAYVDEQVEKAVAEAKESAKATIADLELKLSQKDADALEEALADELAALAQKLRDRTVKAPAAEPVDGAPAAEEVKPEGEAQ